MNKSKQKRLSGRKARKTAKTQKKRSPSAFRMAIPTTSRQYFSRSRQFQETWDSVAHVISRMRADRLSLKKASKDFAIKPEVVLKLGGSALRKKKNGRYVAKKKDRLLRVLSVLSADGKREIALRDSSQSSLLGSYWDAVQRYLQTGDSSALKRFEGKKIRDASGKRYLLFIDLNQLNRLGSAGVLSFESLYGRAV